MVEGPSRAKLVTFAPVPRRKVRVDGWGDEYQRAFIAALAVRLLLEQLPRRIIHPN
jgi:hypothetical protein